MTPPPPSHGTLTPNARVELVSHGAAIRIEPGKRTEFTITLRNRSVEPIVIEAWESSCECFRLSPAQLAAGGEQDIAAVIDLRDEPAFQGELLIELTAKGVEPPVTLTIPITVANGKAHPEGAR